MLRILSQFHNPQKSHVFTIRNKMAAHLASCGISQQVPYVIIKNYYAVKVKLSHLFVAL